MTSEDARLIEEAFRSRLAATTDPLSVDQGEAAATGVRTSQPAEMPVAVDLPAPVSTTGSSRTSGEMGRCNKRRPRTRTIRRAGRSDIENSSIVIDAEAPSPEREAISRPAIDKSVLAFNEPRRYRNRAHLEFVAWQPCLICERRPSDAHHIRFAQPSALGRRVSDEFTVPLCRLHHRALHRRGDEAEWWNENNIDAIVIAQKLWMQTRLRGLSVRACRSEQVLLRVRLRTIPISARFRSLGQIPSALIPHPQLAASARLLRSRRSAWP
jgi:hypothetical protein